MNKTTLHHLVKAVITNQKGKTATYSIVCILHEGNLTNSWLDGWILETKKKQHVYFLSVFL